MALISEARRAGASAQLLLDAGDCKGACNRAYYAMFHAARAALMALDDADDGNPRSHSGLVAAFSLRLVKTGRVGVELGRGFNRVAEIRQVADYRDEPIALQHAAWAVSQAQIFVRTIDELVSGGSAS